MSSLIERLVFFGKLKEHFGVGDLRFKVFLALDFLFQPTAILQKLLRGFLIIPEIRRGGLCFDGFQFFTTRLVTTRLDGVSDGQGRAQDLIARTLDLSAGILARDFAQLPVQLVGRLAPEDDGVLVTVLEKCRLLIPCPALVLCRPTLTPPGAEIRRFEGHENSVTAVARVDNHRVVSGSRDKTLRLWDRDTGAEIRRFEGTKMLSTQWLGWTIAGWCRARGIRRCACGIWTPAQRSAASKATRTGCPQWLEWTSTG